MNSYRKSSLQKMINAYNIVLAKPGCTVWDLCDELDITIKPARRFLKLLLAEGYVSMKAGARTQSGQHPNAYTVTSKGAPRTPPIMACDLPKRPTPKTKVYQPRVLPDCKRVIKKATQIGMAPYADLPAGFFARTSA